MKPPSKLILAGALAFAGLQAAALTGCYGGGGYVEGGATYYGGEPWYGGGYYGGGGWYRGHGGDAYAHPGFHPQGHSAPHGEAPHGEAPHASASEHRR